MLVAEHDSAKSTSTCCPEFTFDDGTIGVLDPNLTTHLFTVFNGETDRYLDSRKASTGDANAAPGSCAVLRGYRPCDTFIEGVLQ